MAFLILGMLSLVVVVATIIDCYFFRKKIRRIYMFTEFERIILHAILEDQLHYLQDEIHSGNISSGQQYANSQQCIAIESIQDKIENITEFY